jgi:hypothetical protein
MDSNIIITSNLAGSARPVKITRITEIIELSDLNTNLSIDLSPVAEPQEKNHQVCDSCKSLITNEETLGSTNNKVNIMSEKYPSKTFTIKIIGKTTSKDTKEDFNLKCEAPQKNDTLDPTKARKKVEFNDKVTEIGLNRSDNSAFVIYQKEIDSNALVSSSSSKINSYFSKFYMDQLKNFKKN